MAEIVNQIEVWLGRSVPESFVPDVRERTAEAFRIRLKPIEGAIDLVRTTTGRFYVASSGPVEKIRLNLSLIGLLPFFEGRIFSSYEVGFWKPDPGLFLHAAHALGVEPQECAVVEDSLPGIQAGVAAGMEVFAFQPNGVDPGIPPEVVIVKRLSDLQFIIGPGQAADHEQPMI